MSKKNDRSELNVVDQGPCGGCSSSPRPQPAGGFSFQMSESSWQDFPALVKWMEKCTVTGLPAAPIINSLW